MFIDIRAEKKTCFHDNRRGVAELMVPEEIRAEILAK
jgi:hypothetical protein